MCYEVRSLTLSKLKYLKRYGGDVFEIKKLEKLIEQFSPQYHASGFDHPDLPVITNTLEIRTMNWGLIPHWTKNAADAVRIQNQTLNARAESVFEKPAFKESIQRRRCLVLVDGFYEHHHKHGKTFPHHILLKNQEPMSLAGIYDTWRSEDMERTTFSIVTTKANGLMARIHNNPKMSEGPRMPVILSKENEMDWLNWDGENEAIIKELMAPFDETQMEAYTVPRLKGKQATGNTEAAISKHTYQELVTEQTDLF